MFNNIIPNHIQSAFPESVTGKDVKLKLLEILGLDMLPIPNKVDFTVIESGTDPDGISWSSIRFNNSLGESVPGIIQIPVKTKNLKLPGIVCIPGTGGSAEEVADTRFEPTPTTGEVLGFGRELASKGYAVISISIKGCSGRPVNPGQNEYQNKYLVAYGRPLMGIIVEETLMATRILACQKNVDEERIGVTGMSLGGLATWYSMACDNQIKVGVPICGGIGSMAKNIHEGIPNRSSSAIFIPHMLRYFDHPEIIASCILPRPFMTVVPTMDEDMPKSGADQMIKEVTPAYQSAGAPNHFKVYQPEGNHKFLIEYFNWAVDWFNKFL